MVKNKLFKLATALCLVVSISFGSFMSEAIIPKVLVGFRDFHEEMDSRAKESGEYTPEEISTVENFLKDVIEKSDFSMAVRFDCMNRIIDDGIFKSSVERCWDMMKDCEYDEKYPGRRYATPEFFHIDASELEGKDYEKYGYLSCKDKRQDFLDTDQIFEYYGNVIVNFKKENLIHRTTMTVGDSLNRRIEFGKSSVTPTFTDDPRFVCISGYPEKYRDILLDLITSGDLLSDRPNLISKPKYFDQGYELSYLSYFELQFHGELSFSKDVESVDILRTENDDDSKKTEQDDLKKRIESLGITCNIIEV